MSWGETLRTALAGLLAHRLRSVLTTLGILIGIAAVVLTVGLGQGAQQQVSDAISRLGSNLLIVAPGSSTTGGVRGGRGTATTLTAADAAALGDHTAVPDVAAVAPVSTTSAPLVAGTANWTTSVVGTTPSWLQVRARTLASGRFLSASDEGRPVTVLGPDTAAQLFGARSPVGSSVSINGTSYVVVGVLAPVGASAGTSEDDEAVVPASTWAQRVASRGTVSTVFLQARSASALSAAYQEATALLLTRHGTDDVTVSTQQSLLSTATATDRTLTVLLAGIAALSLLVGGIGVMNIMLVSVTERVREIGLRKALGATPTAIRRQFLLEASALGVTGGVLGLGLGVALSLVLPRLLSQPVVLSPYAAVGAVAVSLGIGVVAGVYPAGRAARLAPIDALRTE